MILTEVGGYAYQYALATASLQFTPIPDRAAIVKDISITGVSANDTWVVTVGGKEIMRFRLLTSGAQHLAGNSDVGSDPNKTFFDYCRWQLGLDPSIPVGQGQIMTVASVGGATGNIAIEFEEHSPSDISTSMLNHWQGKEFLIPLTAFLSTNVAAAGVVNNDTQVGPAWLPNFLVGVSVTSAWRVQLLAAFFQGAGVNTFSGAVNHQSITNTVQMIRDSVNLGSRTTKGIPNVGVASAAGSANTVLQTLLGPYHAFDFDIGGYFGTLDVPIVLQNGDTFNVADEVTGDVTGGASYSAALKVFAARVSQVQ